MGLVVALALLGQETLFHWLGSNPSLAQTAYRMLVWTIGVDVARADPAAAAAARLSAGLSRLRRPHGLGAVAAVRPRPRALPAVRVPAHRGDRDRRRLPDRGDPQSGARGRGGLRGAHGARRGHRRGARRVARLDPGAAQGRGAGVRDGPQLHAGDAAAHRRDRQGVQGQRRVRRAGLALPRPRDSRRGRSCSSSR